MIGLAILTLALMPGVGLVQTGAARCLDLPDAVAAEKMLAVRMTDEGRRLLPEGQRPFLHVRYLGLPMQPSPTTARLMDGMPAFTEFLFTRDGTYQITLHGSPRFNWPFDDGTGTPVEGCVRQDVTVRHVEVKEFQGIRGHGWINARLLTSVEGEVGGSIFFGRLGLAGTVNVTAMGDPENRWVPGLDVRWRGARGYLGGGARYFHRPEADRHRFRPVFVAGQELPPLKGLPAWFVLDVRIDRYRPSFWTGMDVSFGVRLDLTGNRQ